MLEPYSPSLIWLIVLGFIIAFILAFGIGANDVANSFGTSVGSKVLTIFQACCLATFFEVAGAILIGYKVSDTMRKGILDVNLYKNDEIELMLGCLSALGSSAAWLIAATFLKLPISGTHSIVGATVGYSLVARGTNGVHWWTLGKIVGSWFISPVLSGCTSILFLWIIKKCILSKPNPVESGLFSLPLFYSFTIFVNVFSIIHDGPKLLYMDDIPLWMAMTISVSIAVIAMFLIWLFVVPLQRGRLEAEARNQKNGVNFNIGESSDTSPEGSPRKRHSANLERQLTVISENTELQAMENKLTAAKYIFPIQTADSKNGYTPAKDSNVQKQPERPKELKLVESKVDVNPVLSPSSSGVPLIMNKSAVQLQPTKTCALEVHDEAETAENKGVSQLFSFLQILTAMFGSFAHGGNDVSNAIGPLVTLWLIYTEGSVQQKSETPIYILLYGGFGISVGLWLWGRRVIQTIGEDLTTITPSTGFTIEIGAAFTVLLASKIGIPISTTHCKVGSVVFVGYFSTSKKGVDWSLFRNIISAWVVTVPIAAVLSAAMMFSLRWAFLL
ncbi:sodium-dependent phosphate transporter 2 [Coccinella septempunctata]|uniref:sodium-dependent phosphate transporter 2 n=1 Tax=Coccinella septempunctata TaxID=41139 RepID=UPI001D06D20D|nr:sodium-dependent phosphate transporter 2 [Coccinella septempunctata]XP_044751796.1 sodium-dependent phosphate transporter 2 [Coccinella septempunctata]XP_044751797.1 sodium-dependent phosphate transporter 2 [Coccinella septempunctata]